MDTTSSLEFAQALLSGLTDTFNTPEAGRLDAYITPQQIVEGTRRLLGAGGWHLSAITGLDVPPTETAPRELAAPKELAEPASAKPGAIELLYHFCHGAAVVTLRLQAPYDLPQVPSICPVLPSATLYERELIEMFGVYFEGTPSTDRLLLPDDWPDNVYPLRKSFKGL